MTRLPFLPKPDDHRYCWVIVATGILGLLACLGLGRFSLGMMLPAMGTGLDLSYSQMGLISTVNFCGYLGAVLLCGRLSGWLGARLLIFLAMALVGISMILVGSTTSYPAILLFYGLTGVGSGLANVPIMALVASWFDPARRGRATGLCVMGNSLGILVTGIAVPVLNVLGGGWQLSWLVLGGIVLAIALLCFALIRNHPTRTTTHGRPGSAPADWPKQTRPKESNRRIYLHCAAIYFLFGFTYAIYITFMITSLVEERGLSEQAAGGVWAWIGALSLVSGPLFGSFSDRFGRKAGLVVVFCIQATAYLLMALQLGMATVYLSIFCFAIVAWSVPSIIAALVGDYAGPEKTATVFGLVTFIFGIGQMSGPALAGLLAEYTSGFSACFLLAAALALCAVLLSQLLPSSRR